MVIRELLVRLGVKTDPKGFKKASSSISGLARSASLLGAALTTGALAIGLKNVIGLASDARETTGALDAVFGEKRRKEIEKWSGVMAKEMGRSRFALQDTASQFGAILKPMVGSADQAAVMSKRLAELSIDLASLRNLTDKEAFEKLRSGIVGSSEPLLTLGVDTRVAALEQFRLSQGIKTAVKAMKPAQVTALRYNLILKKTEDATGNAALTSGDFAGTQKRLQGVLRDLGISIGKLLIPAATRFATSLADLIGTIQTWVTLSQEAEDKNNSLSVTIHRVIGAAKILKTVIVAIFSPIGAITAGIIALIFAFNALTVTAVRAWLAAFFPAVAFVALLGIISAAIVAVIQDLNNMGEGNESVIGGIISEFQRWRKELGSITLAIAKMISIAIKSWTEGLAKMAGASDDFATNLALLFTDMFNTTLGDVIDTFVKSFKETVKFVLKSAKTIARALGISFDTGDGVKPTGAGILSRTANLDNTLASVVGADSVLRPGVASAAESKIQSSVNSTANITVNTQPGADGREVAEQVASKVREVNEQDRRAAFNFFRPSATGA